MNYEQKMLIGKAAYDLHMQYSGDLSVKLSNSEMSDLHGCDCESVEIHEDLIVFKSLDSRNEFCAFYVFEDKKEGIKEPYEWLQHAHDVWVKEIRNLGECEVEATGYLLALVHEVHDIFLLSADCIVSESESLDLFDVLRVLPLSIPLLRKVSADSLIKISIAQHEPTKNNFVSGVRYTDLKPLLLRYPGVCIEIHEKLRECLRDEVVDLYTTVILTLAHPEPENAFARVTADLDDPEVEMKNHILWVCGRLLELELLPSGNAINQVKDSLLLACANDDESIKNSAISVMARLIGRYEKLDAKLLSVAEEKDQYALCQIASSLPANHALPVDGDAFRRYLNSLCCLEAGNDSGIRSFDYALSRLVGKPELSELCIACLGAWIINQSSENQGKAKGEIEQFGCFLIAVSRDEQVISVITTEWLVSEDRKLNFGASVLLSFLWVHRMRRIKFNKEKLDLMGFSDKYLCKCSQSQGHTVARVLGGKILDNFCVGTYVFIGQAYAWLCLA